jgi:hypothetical protein
MFINAFHISLKLFILLNSLRFILVSYLLLLFVKLFRCLISIILANNFYYIFKFIFKLIFLTLTIIQFLLYFALVNFQIFFIILITCFD